MTWYHGTSQTNLGRMNRGETIESRYGFPCQSFSSEKRLAEQYGICVVTFEMQDTEGVTVIDFRHRNSYHRDFRNAVIQAQKSGVRAVLFKNVYDRKNQNHQWVFGDILIGFK